MKMFFIPNPWDYHRNDGFFVVARDQESALKKLRKHVEKIREENAEDIKEGYDFTHINTIEWDRIIEITSGISTAGGCDD